jgi:hypothetical protein
MTMRKIPYGTSFRQPTAVLPMTFTEMSERLYAASTSLFVVARELRKIGMIDEALLVERAGIYVPMDVAKQLS